VNARPDWLSGWNKRVKITIDHLDVTSALTNFPMLVYLSTASGRGSPQDDLSCVFNELQNSDANRKKIAVTKSDGITECYVQIERWDSAIEKAWLWVKVPSVSNTSDTDLYLYYDKDHADNTAYVGDTGSTPAQTVWDANFHGVWHLSENPGGTAPQMNDSTSYGNHGTTSGPMASGDQVAGVVDGSLNFSSGTGATPDKWTNCTKSSSLNMGSGDLTLETWFRVKPGANVKNGQPNSGPFAGKGSIGTNGKRYMLMIFETGQIDGGIDDDTVPKNVTSTAGGYDDNAWHYAAVVRGGNYLRLYVDGSEVPNSPVDITGYGSIDDPYSFKIAATKNRANQGDPNEFCNATIDEVRISNTARTAAYVKASYESGRDHLIDFGTEETGEVDTYASNYSTLKDTYSLNETVYAKAKGLISGGSVWLSGWGKRVKLTIDQNDIDSTLSNHPVLVYLSNSSSGRFNEDVSFIFDGLQSYDNRKKIAVTTSDKITQCYVEIQRWDDANEQAWLWVKVPVVNSTADTDLYLYYDKDHADNTAYVGDPDSTAAENVWDSGFKGVWHMDESGDGTLDEYKDSTQYNNHGQGGEGNASYIPTRTTGPIGYGQDFNDDLVDCGNDTSLDITGNQITLECWIRYPSATHEAMGPLNHKGWNNGYRIVMLENSTRVRFQLPGATHNLQASQGISTNTWHYIAAVYNGSKMMIHIDGAKDAWDLNKTDNILPSSPERDFWIGHGDQPKGVYWSYPWVGQVDEVRISDTGRNAAWIKATYQSGIDDLLDYGTEEIGVLYDFKYYSDWTGTPDLEWTDVKVGENPLTEWRSSYTLEANDPTGVWGLGVYDAGTSNLRCSCSFTVSEVDTYDSDYATPKDTYSIGETVYAKAKYLPTQGSVWLSGWDKRVKLAIDQNEINSDLSNFPLLIYLGTSSGRNNDDVSFIFDELQSDDNRKKIAVTTSNKITQCYVEIERWNDTAEEAWLWVKVPVVNSTVDTDLYLYYDRDHADNTAYVGDTNSAAAENVWDADFKGVWHLPEDPSGTPPQIRDSTSNNNDGTSESSMTPNDQVPGKIDGSLEFDNVDDYVDMEDPSSLNMGTSNFTIEAWVKLNASTTENWPTIVDKGAGSPTEPGYWFFWYHSYTPPFIRLTISNGTQRIEVDDQDTDVEDGSWYYVVGVVDRGANGTIYVNGSLTATEDFSSFEGSIDAAYNFTLSCATDDRAVWDGVLDEVRVSKTVRNASWIKVSYESERDDLVDFGTEENGVLYDFRYYSDWVGSRTEEGSELNVGESPLGEWRSSYELTSGSPGTWGLKVFEAGTTTLRATCTFTVQAVPEFPHGAVVVLIAGFAIFLAKRKTLKRRGTEP